MKNINENDVLKIQTIKTPGDNEVSFCPERGGIITSLKIHGKEILYMEEETFYNQKVSVHGGIPILFPNSGPIESPQFPGLKEHGFARTSSEWKSEVNPNGFFETLISDEEKYKSYPYKFQFFFEGVFEENGSFTINQTVKNLEEEKELPLSLGLHPYFKVPNSEKSNIKFNFNGGNIAEEKIGLWSNGEYICIDNPKLNNHESKVEVAIPDLGTLIIDASENYRKIWIWSLPEKDFICIEPMMRDKGGLIVDPEIVPQNGTYSIRVNFDLK